MRLAWTRPVGDVIKGRGFGYTTASNELAAALERAGATLDDDAPLAVHFTPPLDFVPLPGRRNLLFTMYEADPPPRIFGERFRDADAVFAPSEFCRRSFVPLVPRGVPLRRVRLGYDPRNFYPLAPRLEFDLDAWKPGDDPFRFLWVGAPNDRKGWPQVMQSWSHVMSGLPFVSLFFKTSDENIEGTGGRLLHVTDNLSVDTRAYTYAEMGELYRRHHAFVWPSQGEGFGLPLLEAMASGIPIITVRHGGVTDFATADVAWFAPFTIDTVTTFAGFEDRRAYAHLGGLAKAMLRVVAGYEAGTVRGRVARGLERAPAWSWDAAAVEFLEALDALGWEEAA